VHVLELWPSPLHRPHLILVPTLDDLVLDFFGSEGSFLLFFFGRPGIFFALGGNGLGFWDTGHADSCSTGCRTCWYVLLYASREKHMCTYLLGSSDILNRAAQACAHGISETCQYLHEHVLLLRSTVNLHFLSLTSKLASPFHKTWQYWVLCLILQTFLIMLWPIKNKFPIEMKSNSQYLRISHVNSALQIHFVVKFHKKNQSAQIKFRSHEQNLPSIASPPPRCRFLHNVSHLHDVGSSASLLQSWDQMLPPHGPKP